MLYSALTYTCNNSPALCSRSYSNITHLGAHDSPFLSNATNKYQSAGNQFFNTTTQLDAGVRLLSAQIHTTNSSTTELRLCHSDCSLLDSGSLVTWLEEIRTWMDNNANEVVTLLLVNSVSAEAGRIGADFTSSGISKYAYAGGSTASSTWPTLQSLISANTRLVTFVASLPSGNTAAPYLFDEFTYIYENPFTVLSPSNFSCLPDRPAIVRGSASSAKSSGRMFLMNHFLDKEQLFGIQTPDVDKTASTNSPDPSITGSLGNAAQTCSTTYGSAPNFILVDYFNVGPAMSTVDTLNGVGNNVVGRKSVTQSILSQSFTGAGNGASRRSTIALVLGLGATFVASLI
ncbi:hypothetical protein EJ08DRAFT_689815 [Tothia fuscella]|uniref:PLC-like phosphodiesterase n=1 Tax=Tothia fuscella TaxID=1048955 RepID=A0A9P4TUV2_9PEZI|nr:hypothetical protein EJ08DRAFT_689815 [Tothia fuscella]